MDADHPQAFTVPLTAAEREQVQLAADAAGKTVDDFIREAILTAAYDPFLAALEQAAGTIASRSAPST
ncbi:hypothetical protein ACIP93_33770 [Streptomyces sp. NPDC088745]|uniref:hypothetical protein n=1 Tax=Streptomyces sp. NPDC088745 TaxID=3365884 RepID=UPI00381DF4FE